MIKCNPDCIPRCDYCIHARCVWQPIVGKVVTGCRRHEDEKHLTDGHLMDDNGSKRPYDKITTLEGDDWYSRMFIKVVE